MDLVISFCNLSSENILNSISKTGNMWKKIWYDSIFQFSLVTQLCPPLCDPMNRSTTGLPVSSPTPGVYSNSCPSSQWCHPTTSSSVVPFSSCLHSFTASGYFPMGQLFPSCGQSIGVSVSASVLPMNIQDWFPLGLTGWRTNLKLCYAFPQTTVIVKQMR